MVEQVGNYTISISLADGIAPLKNNFFILSVIPNVTINYAIYEDGKNESDKNLKLKTSKATMKLTSISRDAKVKVKFSTSENLY